MRPEAATQLQLGVEDEQRHQAEPEDRDRMAGKADEPRDMVDELAAVDRRDDAERHAESVADTGSRRCASSMVAGNTVSRSVGDRLPGGRATADVPGQDVADIGPELLPDRPVEAELLVDPLIGLPVDLRAVTASTGSAGSSRPMRR